MIDDSENIDMTEEATENIQFQMLEIQNLRYGIDMEMKSIFDRFEQINSKTENDFALLNESYESSNILLYSMNKYNEEEEIENKVKGLISKDLTSKGSLNQQSQIINNQAKKIAALETLYSKEKIFQKLEDIKTEKAVSKSEFIEATNSLQILQTKFKKCIEQQNNLQEVNKTSKDCSEKINQLHKKLQTIKKRLN